MKTLTPDRLREAMKQRRKLATKDMASGVEAKKAWRGATFAVAAVYDVPVKLIYDAAKARRAEKAARELLEPPKRQPLPPRPKEPFLEPEENRTARFGPVVMRKRAVAGIR